MDHQVPSKKKILVSPLNWGLGHATRCIPIIDALIKNNYEPVIASDGLALNFLKKEFPTLRSYLLPGYNIKYSRGSDQRLKLLLSLPRIIKTIRKERAVIRKIISKENVVGIISDNRFGVRSNKIPSVYITHQLNVLSGNTTAITSRIHQKIISKFDECWIPDNRNEPKLSGDLSRDKNNRLRIKFIGPLSRLHKDQRTKKYDLLVVLSGPEPQRSILEQKLLIELKSYNKNVLLIRGVICNEDVPLVNDNIEVVNYMLTEQLQQVFNESDIILARSGYSTIMDLYKLEKKAFFIPTPGQYEQEYLAKRMKELNISPFVSQDKFDIKMLEKAEDYKGFQNTNHGYLNTELFRLF